MGRFIERHYGLSLAIALPISSIAGVAVAIGIWDLLMVRIYPGLMTVLQVLN